MSLRVGRGGQFPREHGPFKAKPRESFGSKFSKSNAESTKKWEVPCEVSGDPLTRRPRFYDCFFGTCMHLCDENLSKMGMNVKGQSASSDMTDVNVSSSKAVGKHCKGFLVEELHGDRHPPKWTANLPLSDVV